MKSTTGALILQKLSTTEQKARSENKGAVAVLDRRTTEKMFKAEKENLTKSQFNGRIMRTVRQLCYDGYLNKLTRGLYSFSHYGRRMASK